MATRHRLLGPDDRAEVEALLAQRPVENLFLAAKVGLFGVDRRRLGKMHGFGAHLRREQIAFRNEPCKLRLGLVGVVKRALQSAQMPQFTLDGRTGEQFAILLKRCDKVANGLMRIAQRFARASCLFKPPQRNQTHALRSRTVQRIGK